jgi:GT2 family glycosyltransferase
MASTGHDHGRSDEPRVSVICAAYNGSAHLQPTLDGLLAQQERDFEAVFVDDASTDGTPALLAGISDPRFRVVRNERNLGLIATRNRAVSMSRGRYVAVTDQDDVSHPSRLRRQADWLDANPGASAVYTLIRCVDASGRPRRGVPRWTYSGQQARAALVYHNFVTHSTLMFRRDRVSTVVYPREYPLCEDYNLLVRLADSEGGLHAIPEALVDYRSHDTNHTRVALDEMRMHSMRLRASLLQRMHLAPTATELAIHGRIDAGGEGTSLDELRQCGAWLAHLVQANRSAGYVPPRDFDAVTASVWLERAHKYARFGMAAWRAYLAGPVAALPKDALSSAVKLALKCALPIARRGAEARSAG